MCLPTLCVCLVPGLCLLCEARAGVPAHCSCMCALRALAESIVRDSWGCACPFVHASLFVSCLGWVYSVSPAGMCQPALRVCVCASCPGGVYCANPVGMCLPLVRACLCLVPWLHLLCETRGNVPAHFVCVHRARATSIVRDSCGCAGPLFVRVCASCLG